MTRVLAILATVSFLAAAARASAAPFEDGVAACKRGDYATAVRELLLLALAGVAEAQYGPDVVYGNLSYSPEIGQ